MIPILTLTRNSSHIWKYYVQSYHRFVDKEKHPLFVVDNCSRRGDVEYLETYVEDGTISFLQTLPANYLYTIPMNLLIKTVLSLEEVEQVLLINPDIEFREGWDEHLSENQGIMGFVLVKPDGTIEHAGAYGGGEHLGRGEMDSPDKFTKVQEVDWVTFGAVAIHRRVLDTVGEMEAKRYPHFGSDREYCRKSRESGFDVTCSPSRLTHYYGWATRPYVFREVPEPIWRAMVAERKDAGVHFPSGPEFTIPQEEVNRRLKEEEWYR